MVRRLGPQAETSSASASAAPRLSAATSTRRAWGSFRATALPTDTHGAPSSRSCLVSATRSLSLAALLALRHRLLPTPQATTCRVTRQSKINGTLVIMDKQEHALVGRSERELEGFNILDRLLLDLVNQHSRV